MSWDYYVVTRLPDVAPDFNKARTLTAHDDDARYYVDDMIEVLQGRLDPDDGTEMMTMPDGSTRWVLTDHHGVGDGGSRTIANTEWVTRDFPDAFAALGITVSWSTGTKVLMGHPDETR